MGQGGGKRKGVEMRLGASWRPHMHRCICTGARSHVPNMAVSPAGAAWPESVACKIKRCKTQCMLVAYDRTYKGNSSSFVFRYRFAGCRLVFVSTQRPREALETLSIEISD